MVVINPPLSLNVGICGPSYVYVIWSNLGENQTSTVSTNQPMEFNQNLGLTPPEQRSFALSSNFSFLVLSLCLKYGPITLVRRSFDFGSNFSVFVLD